MATVAVIYSKLKMMTCSKTLFRTKKAAVRVVRRGRLKHLGKRFLPYKCRVCPYWHLTTSKPLRPTLRQRKSFDGAARAQGELDDDTLAAIHSSATPVAEKAITQRVTLEVDDEARLAGRPYPSPHLESLSKQPWQE